MLGAILEFFIVALVLFIVVVKFMGALSRRDQTPVVPTTKSCGECLEEIPLAAKRCKACTSPQ